MNPSHSSDVSLYELAANSEQPPNALQLSPTTFKSLVGLLLDFLVEQNLPATIWLKLPRGDAWQAELDRFCQSSTAVYSIYSLQTYQKLSTVDTSCPPSTAENLSPKITRIGLEEFNLEDVTIDDLPDLPGPNLFTPPANAASRVQTLPLAAESQLKREYFLLVAAPAFYGLVLAHRPRSVRGFTDGAGKKLPEVEDHPDRKHPLLGICSFDQAVIQKVLEEGINAAICFGQANTTSSTELQDLLVSWDNLKQQNVVNTLDPILMGDLLTKQIQRQEELWRTTAAQRRQVEALPVLQQENVELQDALRSRDEFVKTIGLELRTPLSTMKTALSLLNSSSLRPPQRQRYMDMLSQQCDRQSSLISGVLDLVQLESEVEQTLTEAVRLSEVVPGVVSTYQPLAQEKGVMLGYVVPEDLPAVSCSVPWVKQIVINLLHNSIKFTPKGGQVWVRARQQGEFIQIEFRDSGIGIAASDIPRIFERFYRVRSASMDDSNGVGLGLSIVQQLLLRSGGSISVKSKQGEGSAFTVLLPIHQ
ncbi:MAG: histidine kinase [Cyanobacteria bacterium RM1_2_2]|nr:histidine kinase [Cyanobacteria bacterium RM1_2_2]